MHRPSWMWPVLVIGGTFAVLLLILWAIFSRPPFSIMVDVSVALGTGLLGAAAIYQTIGENERKRIDEANRRADRAPHLRILTLDRPTTRLKPADPLGEKKGGSVSYSFKEKEVFVENVGPGIAGEVTARFISMYLALAFDSDSAEDETETYLSPKETLKRDVKFEENPLRLPSQYVPVGPENKMRLFNADESAKWAFQEEDRDTRAMIVHIDCKDLDHNPANSVTAVVAWYETPPELRDVDEEEFPTPGTWGRASPELEAEILSTWEKWQTRNRGPKVNSAQV